MVKKLHEYDFHRTDISRPDAVDAQLYLSEHFVELVALDAMRAVTIAHLVERGFAEVDEGGEHIRMTLGTTKTNVLFLKGCGARIPGTPAMADSSGERRRASSKRSRPPIG